MNDKLSYFVGVAVGVLLLCMSFLVFSMAIWISQQ